MGLLVRYGPEGADMQVVGPGYCLAGAGETAPDATAVDYDAASRKLLIRTDLFGVNPVHVLVRDGRLWAADSLAGLRAQPDVPRGMLALGACVALCVTPAQRPSVFACGLSVIGGSVIECTPGRIRTTPHWGKSQPPTTAQPWTQGVVAKLRDTLAAAISRREAPWISPQPVNEEALPAAFEDAVAACEGLPADDTAARELMRFRAEARAGRKTLLSALGAGVLLAGEPDLVPGPDVLPRFISRHAEENRLALRLLRPDFARRVKLGDWREELAGEPSQAARRAYLRTVLLPTEVPQQARTAAAAGIELRTPFLDREVAALALSHTPGDERVRALAHEFAPPRAPEAPAPPGGVSARARANWIALYDKWLNAERLEAMEVVEAGRVRELLIAYAKLHSYAPTRVAMDRVLKKLTSLSILRERLS